MIINLLNKSLAEQTTIYIQAAQLLKSGELVAFPTETVYGLGADATNPEAIAKIFTAKGRPADHPVIVHISDMKQLSQWAKKIPDAAIKLAKHFWPGPLTLILPAAENVPTIITGGQKTIGIRMPGHPVAQKLLLTFGGAIAAPSANRFGRISPTRAEHVAEELGDSVALILDGGSCALGLESTIIDLSSEHPRLLRPGPLTSQEIGTILQEKISTDIKNAPRVSGSLPAHYAPQTPLMVLTLVDIKKNIEQLVIHYSRIVILSQQSFNVPTTKIILELMPADPLHYGQQLYAKLRELDHQDFNLIIVEQPPKTTDWLAINDRLQRAEKRT